MILPMRFGRRERMDVGARSDTEPFMRSPRFISCSSIGESREISKAILRHTDRESVRGRSADPGGRRHRPDATSGLRRPSTVPTNDLWMVSLHPRRGSD
jgi:hypothetical protein